MGFHPKGVHFGEFIVFIDNCGVFGDTLYHNAYLRRIENSTGVINTHNAIFGDGVKFTLVDNSSFKVVTDTNYAYGAYIGSGLGSQYDIIALNNGTGGTYAGIRVINEVTETPGSLTINAISSYNTGDNLELVHLATSTVSGVFTNSANGSGISCAAGVDKNVFASIRARSNALYGISFASGANANVFVGNDVGDNTTGSVSNAGTANIIRNNRGYVTENSGTATVLNTTTSIVVNHGLATTPTRVQITPRENPTNAVSFWWVGTLTTTQFTINVNADPGASNLDFDWRAVVGEGN